ncbi:hypothetical protein BGX34_000283 [Mortierella sp. NVP85]|nr:hypothetical protein BGX34_000283 [Mortierella sp. NVP85]
MDRKSILNCSLVSTHWHGPARVELARIIQDMPFNGQGLVHAIRTRFAFDTFPFVSMAQFDKLVCNLSEIYYLSNPETKEVFAPAYPPDVLYQLFWTFLFIDQEFRNPRTRPKVSCNYFVRLLEEAGYPRLYFDKKVLKNIYNDIKAKPLLPAPHLIRSWQEVDVTPASNGNLDHSNGDSDRPTIRTRHSSFMSLANSMRLEEPFKRVRRWWKSAREGERGQLIRMSSQLDTLGLASEGDGEQDPTAPPDDIEGIGIETAHSSSPSSRHREDSPPPPPSPPSSLPSGQLPRSNSSILPQGVSSTAPRSFRSRFGASSDSDLNKRVAETTYHTPSPILNRGFTTVPHGWLPEGDGLDQLICFPKPKRPSTLGPDFHILQSSDLTSDVDTDL